MSRVAARTPGARRRTLARSTDARHGRLVRLPLCRALHDPVVRPASGSRDRKDMKGTKDMKKGKGYSNGSRGWTIRTDRSSHKAINEAACLRDEIAPGSKQIRSILCHSL